MTKLEKEAEEYAKKAWSYEYNEFLEDSWQTKGEVCEEDFIAGAKSNYVKRKVLKGKLNLLQVFYYGEDLKDEDVLAFYKDVYKTVKEDLKAELKELG